MANTLGNFSPEHWSARVQYLLKRNLVGAAIANTEERATLTNGTKVHRPYHSEIYAADYTKGTAVTLQDIATTDEYLTVDQVKVAPVYVDDVDRIQNKYDTMGILADRAAYELRNVIDQKILGEVSNAALSNTSASSLSPANVVQVFSEAKAALSNNFVEETKPWFVVMDPDTVGVMEQYFGATGFQHLDKVLEGGWGTAAYLGDWFGLKCFKSQNIPFSVPIVFTDDPSNTKTLIINGVTFTFVSTIGSTAGNVLIDAGSDVDVTIGTNLVGAINNPLTTSSTQVALSANNAAKLKKANIVASYAAGSNTLTITGNGKITIAGDYDNGTKGTQTKTLPVGQMGCIDLVIQQDVNAKFNNVPDKLGTNILTWALYGTKTFVEGAQRMYKLSLNA